MNAAQAKHEVEETIRMVSRDMCRRFEGTAYYDDVASYFFDLLNYVHKSKEWVDSYPTVELDNVIKFPNLRNYQNDQS